MKNIVYAMKTHYQIEGKQTILQHGLSVFKYSLAIRRVLKGQKSQLELKIPQWMIENREYILDHLLGYKSVKHYCLWHDLGKPFCRPDH